MQRKEFKDFTFIFFIFVLFVFFVVNKEFSIAQKITIDGKG